MRSFGLKNKGMKTGKSEGVQTQISFPSNPSNAIKINPATAYSDPKKVFGPLRQFHTQSSGHEGLVLFC